MEKLYKNLSEKKFKIYVILMHIIADISILIYIFKKFTNKERFDKSSKIALEMVQQIPNYNNELSPEIFQQLYELLVNVLLTSSIVIILLHFIINLLFYKGKKGAETYLRLQALIGLIGTAMMGISSLTQLDFVNSLFLILAFFYFYSFFGIGYFQKKA